MNVKLVCLLTTATCFGLLLYLYHPTAAPSVNPSRRPSELHNYSYPLQELPANDYSMLINYSFSFDLLHEDCKNEGLLVILVHSAPSNFDRRQVIRRTWGQGATLYFMMGLSRNKTVQKHVKQEDARYEDLIQGDFLDQYRNLSYKHVMTLKYAIYHCARAKYVLKTDDDVFVNVATLRHFLTSKLAPFGSGALLYCPVKECAQVLRTYRSKWRVGFLEYPYRTYPPYCLGWAVLYSPDVVFGLYKSAQNCSDVFWIDDVLVTGILARKNNFTHADSSAAILSKGDQERLVGGLRVPGLKPFLFGQPNLSVREIERLWMAVKKRQPGV